MIAKNSLVGTGIMKHHIVSGAAVSLLGAGTINAMALKKGEITKKEALNDIVKRTSQGTIATAAMVAASNYNNQNNGLFKALTALSVGAMGVYAIEVLDKKLNQKTLEKKVNNAK